MKSGFRFTRSVIYSIIVCAVIFFVVSCAQVSAPQGGPRDIQPPVPLKSKPVNYATNFKGKKVIIQFDEYLKLNNINQELLITPVPEEKPDIKLKGKNLVVKFNEELKDSSTYNINFYNAIADLNENNPLPNFMFEFSTSESFDSLYLSGNIKNAFNGETEENMYVMLYSKMHDSTPRKVLPDHISKCDENGNFYINNIKHEDYYLFGLKDMNSNMLFDLPNESIAFSDTTVRASFELREVVDTFKIVSMVSKNLQDTLYRDSLHRHMEWMSDVDDVELLFFTEESKRQYVSSFERPTDKQIYFAFNMEVTDSFQVKPLNKEATDDWYIQEVFPDNDSIVYWLADSNFYKTDSLIFEISYTMLDSNEVFFTKKDTVLQYFEIVNPFAAGYKEKRKDKKPKKEKKEGKAGKLLGDMFEGLEKKEEEKEVKLSDLKVESENTSVELHKDLPIELNYPVKSIDTTLIELYKVTEDTILTPHDFTFSKDSLHLRKYIFAFERDEADKFNLVIPAGTFTDIYGNVNDTTEFDFNTKTLKDYSVLSIRLENIEGNAVVQLLSESDKLRSEFFINTADTILNIEYLKPGKVKFKLFYDVNNNKEWDTGNFEERRQPESVYYFPAVIELIGGVDYEYDWNLKEEE